MNNRRLKSLPIAGSRGMTLVELMVAIAISLFMVGALVALYVSNSVARSDLDRSSRQIENGRFAMDMLRDDITLAGFYGELAAGEVSAFVEANPSTTTLTTMGWVAATTEAPAPVQGLNTAATIPAGWTGCTAAALNWKSDTGVLVVRRLLPDAIAASAALANRNYLQSNGCKTVDTPFVFAAGPGSTNFTLKGPDCVTATPVREYQTRLYFVATCGVCSGANADNVPTLKVRELIGNQMVERIISDGIENLQFEFGVDTNGDGVVDDRVINTLTDRGYVTTAAAAEWRDVVAVRVRLIARTVEPSPGYVDDKTYFAGTPFAASAPAASTNFKRRAYVSVVALPNVAGPREAP